MSEGLTLERLRETRKKLSSRGPQSRLPEADVVFIYDECGTPEFEAYIEARFNSVFNMITKEQKMSSDFTVQIGSVYCKAKDLCEELEELVGMFNEGRVKLTRVDEARLESIWPLLHEIDSLKKELAEWPKKKDTKS